MDAGSNFAKDELKQNLQKLSISIVVVPTGSHELVGNVERAHQLLRSTYPNISIHTSKLTGEEKLTLSFPAINDATSATTGTNPTALAF